MPNDIAIRFQSTGLTQLQKDLLSIDSQIKALAKSGGNANLSVGLTSTAKAAQSLSAAMAKAGIDTAKFSATIGASFSEGQKLAQSLNLTGTQALNASKQLAVLNQSGATLQQRQQALNQSLGLTTQQFLTLDRAVRTYQSTQAKASSGSGFDKDLKGAQSLAKALGTTIPEAQKLSQQLGLTATESAKLVNSLKSLQAGGATAQQSFNQLNQGLGTTAKQYQTAEAAIARYNAQTAASVAANDRAKASALAQAKALEDQAKATEKQKTALQALAVGSGALAVGIGGVFAKGTQDFAEFDKAIRTFGVVTESSGTKQLAALRAEVERLGATSTKTPQEIANLAIELGRAGFSAEKTTDALSGVVLASQATGDDLARIGQVIGATINQFKLAASDSNKIADLIAATSNASAAGANDLGEALSYVGTQAEGSNQSLEVTLLALGQLANAGIKGSAAGTGLAEALRRIKIVSAGAATDLDGVARTSIKAQKAFSVLSGNVRNANGQLKPLPEILGIVQKGVEGLAQGDKDIILDSLFGVQGGRTVASLIGGNADQVASLKAAIDNAEGSAEKAGLALQKGLGGALTGLQSSTSLASQTFGEFAGAGLEPLVRGATEVLRTFLALPAPIKQVVLATTTLTGVLAAATFAIATYQIAQNAGLVTAGKEAIAIVANTIAVGANTIAKIANTQASFSLAGAQAAITGAFGASAPVIAGASAAMGTFASALLAAAPLLLTVGAGLAAIEFTNFTNALTELNQKLDETGSSTDAVLRSGISVQQDLKNAIDATAASQGKLTEAQKKGAKEAIANANQQIDLLKQQITELANVPEAKAGFGGFGQEEADAQNNRRKAQIASINAQIAAIERQRNTLASSLPTEGAKANATAKNTEAIKANKDALQEQADALKEQRDAAKLQEDQAFQDQNIAAERARADAKAEAERQLQKGIEALQLQSQERIAEQEKLDKVALATVQEQQQTALNEKQKAFDTAQQSLREQGQRRINEIERAFNQQQQQEQEAFNQQLADRRKAGEAGFAGAQQEIDRQLQLEFAKTEEEKKRLEEQFAAEDAIAQRRAELEAPLQAAKQAFEQQLRDEEKAFQEAQNLAKLDFEANVLNPQKLLLEQQLEQQKLDFETNVLTPLRKQQELELETLKTEQEKRLTEIKKQAEEEIESRKLAFAKEQQALDRAFEDEKRSLERAFKEEQRRKDLESAQQIKAILESAKIPTPEPGNPPNPAPTNRQIPGLKTGGNPSDVQWVGEAGKELLVNPPRGSYVLNHKDAMAIAGLALSPPKLAPLGSVSLPAIPTTMPKLDLPAVPGGNTAIASKMLSKLTQMEQVLTRIETRPATPAINFNQTVDRNNYDQLVALRSLLINTRF